MRIVFPRVLRLGIVLLVLGGACKGKREIGLDITLPKDLVDTTAWFEVGAFKDSTCAAVTPMLGDGVPEGATVRVSFARDDATTPKFGDIPNGKYAFAAVARDSTCAVLATGCHEDDVGSVDKVSITMTAVDTPTGKCAEGASCQAAKCVPANDNSDPSVGAGCSLELVGAGPLAKPVGGQGTFVSAPAIIATTTGFTIVYREIDPSGAGAKLTILPIDLGGGALKPERPGLPNRCSASDEVDGVGLVVNGTDGQVALAKAPCGDKPALELLNFKTTTDADPGRPLIGKFLVSTSPTGVRVSLGAARAAALRTGGGLVVYTEGGHGGIATMDPEKGITGPNGSFGGATGITDTWIAANDKVLALLAVGTGDSAAPADPDGGGGGSPDASVGTTDSTLRLLMVPSNTPVDTINAAQATPRAPITFPGIWGSIAAREGRVIVLSDGSGPGRSVTYRAFNLNSDAVADQAGFSVEGTGKVTAGDVAIVGDRAYFAALKQGAVALHVYNNATTTLTPLHNVFFAKEPRISGISIVRDGRVSVAATDKRVAVVWTTAKVLNNNDATGGYAVFGCTK